jgi:hypothetical protein
MGLLQGRGQPAAGGPVQVREDAVEVSLILESWCLALKSRVISGAMTGTPSAVMTPTWSNSRLTPW